MLGITRTFIFLLALALAAGPAFSQVMLVPRGSLGAFYFGQNVGAGLANALSAATELKASAEEFSRQVADARQEFWSGYKVGDIGSNAESEFVQLLFAKDLLYLSFFLPEGPHSPRSDLIRAIGGEVDGGIPDNARPSFYIWIEKIREQFGARYHYPDREMGREPEMIVPTPTRLLEAMGSPEVQAAYDDYKFARDREEFAAAGRLADFEQVLIEARRNVEVGPPETRTDSWSIHDYYAVVPEDFVPPIRHEISGDLGMLVYEAEKTTIGSLRRIVIQKFSWPAFDFDPNRFQTGTRDHKLLEEDVIALFKAGAQVIACSYVAEKLNYTKVQRYWYKVRPEAADRARLASRISAHPILEQIRDPVSTCPATLDGKPPVAASAGAPAPVAQAEGATQQAGNGEPAAAEAKPNEEGGQIQVATANGLDQSAEAATGIVADLAGALAAGTLNLAGRYEVEGTNRNGSTYSGSVEISEGAGGQFDFVWSVPETYKGKGHVEGDRVVVDWGGGAPVIYSVTVDGVLDGTWDRGRATETLRPKR